MLDKTKILIGQNCSIDDGVILGYDKITKIREPIDDDRIIIGDNVTIRAGTIIYPGVKIGSGCMINHNCIIRENTVIGDNNSIGHFSQIEGNTVIGNNNSIWTMCHITAYSTIGNNIFMAPGVILTNDPIMGYRRPQLHKYRTIKGPTICDNVRIAAGCIIQPGVTIGREAVVGNGSIVTKDIPPYSIFYGVPARYKGLISLEQCLDQPPWSYYYDN